MTEFNTIGKRTQMTVDSVPTDGSSNPVSSNGVYDALALKQDTMTVDAAPTQSSTNPVQSGGVYSALGGKQDTLTFDNSPTSGSDNPVKSGGVYSALGDKFDTASMITTTGSGASAGITSADPIAMKGWVNSSISTNTATFRGTFSVEGTGTYDLGLTITYDPNTGAVTGPSNSDIATALASKMTTLSITPTNNDYVFVSWDYSSDSGNIDKYDRFKFTAGTPGAWSYEFTLNNSSFTSDQWAAINSGINATKIGTYDGYANTISGKQGQLQVTIDSTATDISTTVDDAPNSSNTTHLVTSAGVYSAINTLSSNVYTKAQTDVEIGKVYTDFRGSNWVFGMSFDRSKFSTDPTGCLTYTDGCTGYTPVSGPTATLARVGADSSWVYNNDGTSSNPLLNVCFYATFTADGVMHEKLNPNNLAQKIATWDNTAKQWTTASGSSSITTEDTMFCIPTMFLFGSSDFIKVSSSQYYNGIVGDARSHTIGGKVYQYLAIGVYPAHLASGVLHSMSGATSTVNTTRPTFRTAAQARKVQNGRAMVWNWFQYNILKILTFFACKSFHGQDRIGMGGKQYGDKASGQTNAMGPFAGSTSTTVSDTNAMKAFIEDFWGHNWEFIDDFACDNTTMNSHILYAGCNVSPTDTPANNGNIPTDKIPLGVFNNTGTTAGWRYGSVFCTHPYAWGMPISEGGSVSAYLCDGVYIGTATTPTLGRVGGNSVDVSGGHAGPSSLILSNGFTSSGDHLGARLAFVFDL